MMRSRSASICTTSRSIPGLFMLSTCKHIDPNKLRYFFLYVTGNCIRREPQTYQETAHIQGLYIVVGCYLDQCTVITAGVVDGDPAEGYFEVRKLWPKNYFSNDFLSHLSHYRSGVLSLSQVGHTRAVLQGTANWEGLSREHQKPWWIDSSAEVFVLRIKVGPTGFSHHIKFPLGVDASFSCSCFAAMRNPSKYQIYSLPTHDRS